MSASSREGCGTGRAEMWSGWGMGTPMRRSGRLRGTDAGSNFSAVRTLRDLKIVEKLKVEPEPRLVAEIPRETKRRVGGDAALPVQNIRNASGRNTQIQSQTIGAQPACLDFFLQNLAGMDGHRVVVL